jgi:hypothetical protein
MVGYALFYWSVLIKKSKIEDLKIKLIFKSSNNPKVIDSFR